MSDPSRRHLKNLASLHRRRHRDRLGQFLVEGVRSVEAAVEAGAPLVEVIVTEGARAEARVATLLERAEVPVHTVAARDLARIADTDTTQGVIAVAAMPRAGSIERGAVVALDGVQDPGNVGTIIRTAAWFRADAVLAGSGTADPFGPKVVRAAMGGLWDLALASTGALEADLQRFKASGLPIAGADLDGEPAHEWSPPRAGVLVLGSEAHGLSDGVRALLDVRVSITAPEAMARRGVESLNVSVAAGVLLHRWLGGGA